MKSNTNTFFYHDKPIFGLDIGFSTMKAMQIRAEDGRQLVSGYGVGQFDPAVIKDGVIIDTKALAQAAEEFLSKHLIGAITTRRVILAIPANRTFSRRLTVPKMNSKDLADAVKLEAEQYIPMPVDELYMDYEIISQNGDSLEILAAAVPKKIVDSYMDLARLLGLEVVTLETTINATTRLFTHAEESDVPTILIDFGSIASDITIYDHGIVVTGTAPGGGDSLTSLIAQKLKVSHQEAHTIKTERGLTAGDQQQAITESVGPMLEQLVKEIQRVIRYYEDRSDVKSKIAQIITVGGGASMPGLSEYLTNLLRLPVRRCDPWQNLEFNELPPPNSVEKSMYATVTGLALVDPQEIFS